MRRSLAALGSLEGDTSNRWFTLAKWQLGGGTAELAAVAVTVKGTKKGGLRLKGRKKEKGIEKPRNLLMPYRKGLP